MISEEVAHAIKQKALRVSDGNMTPPVRIGTAQRLIKESTYWYDHPSGRPVYAPKFSERVANGPHGWEVEFGSNKFLIGRAASACVKAILDWVEAAKEGKGDCGELRRNMEFAIRRSVANFEYKIYPRAWDLTPDGFMKFGAQGIRVNEIVDFLLSYTGIHKACK